MKRPTKSEYSGKFQSSHKAAVETFKPHLFLISYLSSCVFCRTKWGIRGGCCVCVPVPSSHSPCRKALWANLTPQLQGETRQLGWGEPNRLGKTQNCLVTLGWVACPAWSDPATGSSTTSPQPLAHEPADFFLPSLRSAEWIIQVLQHPGS